ncbi:UBA/TS-N domain protein [Fonsecaea pedrosoi]|nr:UBA/TS-N domain protein [Fonsecaea pedrosoi]
MEDIAGLKWSATPANGQNSKPAPATSNFSAFNTLKPTPPTSGRASPFNSATSQPPSKPSTPGNDSFANLVSFGPASHKNLSLSEQQRLQVEAKAQQQKDQARRLNDQFAGGDDQFWNNLGSGRGTPAIDTAKNQTTNHKNHELDDTDDDLFAAFNKPTAPKNDATTAYIPKKHVDIDDNDDPFGLSKLPPRRADTAATASTAAGDDDDVLGLLGKPVSTAKSQSPPLATGSPATDRHPQDKAVAELVDMGFPADKAKVALEATESGIDVQAAVGYLLNQAHAEARQKAQSRTASGQIGDSDNDRIGSRNEAHASRTRPPWDNGEGPRRTKGSTQNGEKDFEQLATEFGSNFLKTANSLWKQGTKRVQQAVQEFNSETEAGNQPRWMREVAERPTRKEQPQRQPVVESGRGRSRPGAEAPSQASMTDEAMMLEINRPTSASRPSTSSRPVRHFDSSADNSRDQSPVVPSRLRDSLPQTQPAFLRQQNQSPAASSRASLTRAAAEEQAAQAYVSSARRRKQPPRSVHDAPPAAVLNSDLLEGGFKDSSSSLPRAAATHVEMNKPSTRSQSQPVKQRVDPTATQVRPPAPTRHVPSIPSIALQASHSHREKGNEHFKRGDYASAHQSYATSLSHLPESHPLTIVLLTNRALTALKIGEPKQAIMDADKAIMIIGPSKGENEHIEVTSPGNMGNKPMREYYGKALMRKAEALEQMEKWTEAAVVWREAVEGGHGGATSIQGRMRAEKAANPQKPKPTSTTAARKPGPASAPASSALRRSPPAPASTSVKPAEAVSRLRAANLAADKLDDEKFRLSESVDARINAWKSGKQDNLRALLGSLDSVLWEGSGWKKISMADLVLPGKVKIQYMKGIGKVHPDKIPTNATTEQRMIAGAVFSALNEAWDKFKAENGL